jgi:hypothetical protein
VEEGSLEGATTKPSVTVQQTDGKVTVRGGGCNVDVDLRD